MIGPDVPPFDKKALRRLFDDALADHRAGRLDAAKAKYAELLRRDAGQADAAHLLGQIAFAEGDAATAVARVEQAIGLDRRQARFHVTLATVLNRLGRADEAEAAARRALVLDRDDGGAYTNLGIALMAREALNEAETAFGRALEIAPGDAVALANMGAVLVKTGNPGKAEPHCRRAVAANPRNFVAWANFAEALHDLGRTDEAFEAARHAIALEPRHAPGHAALGVLLLDAGLVDAAIASCERALELQPNERKYLGNLANAFAAAGRFDEALAAYERFLAVSPTNARAHYNKALYHLLQGELDVGLQEYEARWGVAGFTWRIEAGTLWSGDSPPGARVLIWPEQGIGDHIFNASFLPAVIRLGVRPIYECDPRLIGLMARSFPEACVIPAGAPMPEHDFHIPAGSLLRVLRARLGDVPREHGYLRADPDRVAHYRNRLAAAGRGPWIGLSWRSAREVIGPHKSMPLAALAPILRTPGARFVTLQYGDTDAEIAAAAAATGAVIHTDPELDRFNDIDGLAALIGALDFVITTSNVTAHIAGALGRESWIALQKVPLWYWESAGEESRYYPSARLFRQSEVGDWAGVARRIAHALQYRLGSK